jgi:Tfp pilus assembly protein PilF
VRLDRTGLPVRIAGAPRLGLLALLGLVALAGCAGGGGAEGRAVPAMDAGADAPERAASERLVERGRSLLSSGRAAEAATVLERAVRVDPSNGQAYLELARTRIVLGEPGVARGLLERAAALLRPYPDQEARVDSLRAKLGGG